MPAELGGVAICDNLELSVNYSVKVAGEGAIMGTYSAPVFIFYERDGESNGCLKQIYFYSFSYRAIFDPLFSSMLANRETASL